ncbi:MAG: hypothetical protein KF820_06825 [Candidatus Paracaedibacteraceae bacterium]|nr:hypothetical protein [Candidatus Paracaedibacteraceae bacterium]
MEFHEVLGIFLSGAILVGAYIENKYSTKIISLRSYYENRSEQLESINSRLWNEFKLYRVKTEEFISTIEDIYPEDIFSLEKKTEWFFEQSDKYDD